MKFDFFQALLHHGVEISDYRFKYRFRDEEIEVAIKDDFDRWGNSVDFVVSIPKTQKSFDKMMRDLHKLADAKEREKVNAHPVEFAKDSQPLRRNYLKAKHSYQE